jgi:hypothetical protein
VIWLVGSSIVFVLPLILAALARLLFEDKSVLVPPENWREIAADPCDHPCSDAAGTCDWRCPHLRSDA